MLIQNKFNEQLSQGQKYERLCLEYLEYDAVEHMSGYFKEYDLVIKKEGKGTKIEVKSDRQASRTGNLAIEYECNNKPSGITSTEADFWIYFIVHPDRDECYIIPTEKLREIVKTCPKVRGGDGMRSKMFLVNKERVKLFLREKNNIL